MKKLLLAGVTLSALAVGSTINAMEIKIDNNTDDPINIRTKDSHCVKDFIYTTIAPHQSLTSYDQSLVGGDTWLPYHESRNTFQFELTNETTNQQYQFYYGNVESVLGTIHRGISHIPEEARANSAVDGLRDVKAVGTTAPTTFLNLKNRWIARIIH